MTVFFLVRHAHNGFVGKGIAGRKPGIHLTDKGRGQAESVADKLAGYSFKRILSSPRDRARETAEPLARRCRLPVEIDAELDEVDFGEWEGWSFEQLSRVSDWHRFNSFRSHTRIPSGEMVIETQARVIAALRRIESENPESAIAVFGHGDPLKLALAYYAGIPVDMMLRLDIGLASVSILELSKERARIACVNYTFDGPAAYG